MIILMRCCRCVQWCAVCSGVRFIELLGLSLCSDGEEELNNVFSPSRWSFFPLESSVYSKSFWVRGNPPETQFFVGTEDGNRVGIRDRRY